MQKPFFPFSAKKFLLPITLSFALMPFAQGEDYRVATDPYFMPYTYRNESGQVVGFNTDIINAIGEDQGFKVRMVEGPWPKIFDYVKDGDEDMVMSWVVKGNPQTQGFLDSEPYIHVPLSSIGYLDNSLQIDDVKSLQNLKVGVVNFSSDENFLRENGVTNITDAKTLFDLYRMTGQKQIDVFVGDRMVMEYFRNRYPQHKLYIKPLHPEQPNTYQPLVTVFRAGDTKLANKFNQGLKNIKNNGKYKEIIIKWFGENAPIKELEQ